MGRYSFIKKRYTVEDCISIDVFYLKQQGYLKESSVIKGVVSWEANDKSVGNMDIIVNTEEMYVLFSYSIRNNLLPDQKSKDKFYKVQLTVTGCNYGGVRYWFSCPCCRRRVGTLHIHTFDNFRCRDCLNLSYFSKNDSNSIKTIVKAKESMELEIKMAEFKKYKYYNGKPTRRYKALLKKYHRTVGQIRPSMISDRIMAMAGR